MRKPVSVKNQCKVRVFSSDGLASAHGGLINGLDESGQEAKGTLRPPPGSSLSQSERAALRMVALAPLLSLESADRKYVGPIKCLLQQGLLERVTTHRRGLTGDLIGVSRMGAIVLGALTGLPILSDVEADVLPLNPEEAAAMTWMLHLSWHHLSSIPSRLHEALRRLEARGIVQRRRLTDNMGMQVEYRRISLRPRL